MPTDIFDRVIGFKPPGKILQLAERYERALGHDPDRLASGPDFLIIGSARSGTTWMKKCISRNPASRILKGEINFFSWLQITPRDYAAKFTPENFKGGHDLTGPYVQGEKSPSYQVMPDERIAVCKALYPKAKIILLVRNPVERAWSHIKHEQNFGRFKDDATHERIIRGGRFELDVRRWARFYPDMHLVPFEDICLRPAETMADIYRLIGAEPIDYRPVLGFEPMSQLKPAVIPDDVRAQLEEAYRGERWDIAHLRSLLPGGEGISAADYVAEARAAA